MRDIQAAGVAIEGQVVPLACSANVPGVFDEERMAGQISGSGHPLRDRSRRYENGDEQESFPPHPSLPELTRKRRGELIATRTCEVLFSRQRCSPILKCEG